MNCVRWIGENCNDETASAAAGTTWSVSRQDALLEFLEQQIEPRLGAWCELAQGVSQELAEELRAFQGRLAALQVAFFGNLVDQALVIRGGIATPDLLRRGIAEHLQVPGLVGFSVTSENGHTRDQLAQAAQYPNGQISYAEVGSLRVIGSNVIPSPGRGLHCTVIAEAGQAEQLSGAFQQAPNPHRRGS